MESIYIHHFLLCSPIIFFSISFRLSHYTIGYRFPSDSKKEKVFIFLFFSCPDKYVIHMQSKRHLQPCMIILSFPFFAFVLFFKREDLDITLPEILDWSSWLLCRGENPISYLRQLKERNRSQVCTKVKKEKKKASNGWQ